MNEATVLPTALPDDAGGAPAAREGAVPKYVSDEVRPDRVVGLLIEYRKKLRRIAHDVEQINRQWATVDRSTANEARKRLGDQIRVLRRRYERLRPVAVDLARHASALVEQARIPKLEKLELSLRLAEFEPAIEEASAVLTARVV